MKKIISYFLIFLLSLPLYGENLKPFILDNSEDFFDLSGKWYFIDHSHFQGSKSLEDQEWKSATIPGFWRTQNLLGIRQASYMLPILIKEDFQHNDLAIFSTGFLGSEEIYFNGKLIGKTASIKDTKEESTFTARPDIYTIPNHLIKFHEMNFLLIKVSDHLNMGGFPGTIYAGELSRIKSIFIRNLVTKIGLSIIFFVFAIYFFVFYLDYKRELPFLLFSLLMFLFGCFVLSVERYLFWFWDGFYLYYYLLNIPMSLLSVVYILLGYSLYNLKPDRFDKVLLYSSIPMAIITIMIGIGQNPEVLMFRNTIFYKFFFYFYWLYIIPTSKLLFKIYKNKYFSYRLILTGAFALILHSLFATLVTLNLLNTKAWYFGEFNLVMILCMSLTLSRKYSLAQEKVINMEKRFRKDLQKEVKRKTSELKEINKELMLANLTKNKLFSIISHDLRSPLILLNQVMKLTQRKKISPKSFNNHIKNLSNHLERNMLFLENLLNWSSSQLYQLKPEKIHFDIDFLIQESKQLWDQAAKNKQIEIFYCSKPNSICYSDRNMLRIILNNLLNNAIKFSISNSIIKINIIETNTNFFIEVIDSGEGIPESIRQSMFHLNHTKIRMGSANEIGHGLGLVMIKDFITQLNEEIAYTNDPNLGSKFSISVTK